MFNIDDGDDLLNLTVAVAGLVITGGDVLGVGGGIRSLENFTLTDTTIADNMAAGADGGGGGLYVSIVLSGAVDILNTSFNANMAHLRGGGVYTNTGILGEVSVWKLGFPETS
ncbi:MAG: hypothetical protein R3C10_13035 [Pirellulales bacterium]